MILTSKNADGKHVVDTLLLSQTGDRQMTLDFSDLVSLPCYKGYEQFAVAAPWAVEPAGPLRADHGERFWFLDFHWPRGLTPMGTVYLHDCYAWGAQLAALQLPLPTGNGLAPKLAGTHVYSTQLPVMSALEGAMRAERSEARVAYYIENFPALWAERVTELESGLARFEDDALDSACARDLAEWALAARAFQRRAWEIHFEIMYPLLIAYLQFRATCEQFGIDLNLLPLFFQGYDNKMMEVDRELWRLAAAARDAGLEPLFSKVQTAGLAEAVQRSPDVGDWWNDFQTFLKIYGWRTEGIADVYLAPWIENPEPALGTIKTILAVEGNRDFLVNRNAAIAEREAAVRLARSQLEGDQQATFDALLETCRRANFNWWNDEHNFYIDLRASIPLRRVCLALGRVLGCEAPDDVLFLFFDEAVSLARGETVWAEWRDTVVERRAFYMKWQERRGEFPPVVGIIPDHVDDPILIEIFGLHHRYLGALNDSSPRTVLEGLGVSKGVVRGRAVVHRNADRLHTIREGEILVCEATSPNWNPAFGKIAACVCDVGGSLTHAAIVAREYRIPCVVGVATGTRHISTGDEIEVDGDQGIVRILRAASPA